MIQINLLPDVKAEYVKAQRTKRTVITLSILISVAAAAIVVLLASFAYGAQNITLRNLDTDINNNVNKIKEVPDLDKILTIQNQLNSLEPLHELKPVVYRLFNYLQQTTPEVVLIDTYTLDITSNTITIDGNAPNLEIVNKYVDTLKFTEIKQTQKEIDENKDPVKAFSDVVLTGFDIGEAETTYTIGFKYDISLFESAYKDIQIVVPKIITTRSELEKPGILFRQNQEQATTEDE